MSARERIEAYLRSVPESQRASALIRLRASLRHLANESEKWTADPVSVPDDVQLRICTGEVWRALRGRSELPARRDKVTHELRIGQSRRLFVEIGLYPDGTPGEVFLTFSKVGSDLRHFADGFAIAVSLLLQHGVPVDEIAHSFEGMRGGPFGDVTGHDNIKSALSVIDLVVQLLRAEYGEKK